MSGKKRPKQNLEDINIKPANPVSDVSRTNLRTFFTDYSGVIKVSVDLFGHITF